MRARGGGLGIVQTLVTQGAIMVVNLGTGVLTARLLGPVGRGEFAAAVLWFMLPAMLATVGLQNGIVYESRRRPQRAASVGLVGLLFATGFYVPAAAASLWVLPSLMHDYNPAIIGLARFAVLASVLNVWMVVARQSLLGTRNMHMFNLSNYASPFVYLLFLVVLTTFGRVTAITALVAQTTATMLVLVPTLWVAASAWRGQRVRLSAGMWPMLVYSLKAAVIDLVVVGYFNVDRLFLVGLVTPAEFGYYGVAASLARLLGVLQSAVSSVLLADLSHRPTPKVEVFIHRLFRILFWVLVVACAAGWLLGDELLYLVYGTSYTGALPVFRILIIDSSVACLAQVVLEAFLATGRPSYPSFVQGTSFGVIAIAMLLLAPTLGAVGAAAALLCGSICKLILLLHGASRIGLPLPSLMPQADDVAVFRSLLRKHRPAAEATASKTRPL
jgi:antigen flippase